jgi:hypothetical protein
MLGLGLAAAGWAAAFDAKRAGSKTTGTSETSSSGPHAHEKLTSMLL